MTNMRSASTVILLRKKSEGFQIYVMKRPLTMRVFQGYTVFPGGIVESQDQQFEWEHYIHHPLNTIQLLPKHLDYPLRALPATQMEFIPEFPYVIAAIREVFEETGILLCQSDNEQRSPQHPTLQLYRETLLKKEITFLEMVKTLDVHLNAEKLYYIGRRITPPPTSVFFDTNFYLTIVPAGTTSIPSAKEVVADDWIEPSVALKLVAQKEIICAPATIECFHALNRLGEIG